jgi:hypothetical protein
MKGVYDPEGPDLRPLVAPWSHIATAWRCSLRIRKANMRPDLCRSPRVRVSLTLRRMAVDGLTGQAEGGRGPPAHVYAVRVSVLGRHGLIFLPS